MNNTKWTNKREERAGLDISVIIVNWNTKDFLKDCISSIEKGASGIPYEIILVDNASSDNSVSSIEANFPDIKLIKNTINKGFAEACNQGASLCRGRYLFLLNPDTVLTGGVLKKLVEFADSQPWFGAVGPRLIGRDSKVQNSVRRLPRLRDILIRDTILKFVIPLAKKERLINELPDAVPSIVDQISGAAFLVKKDLWEKLGGMDKKFFMFYEEVDLCRRIKDLGYNIYYLPSVSVVHLGGGSRHRDRSNVFYHSMRSQFLYFKKYEPSKRLLLFKIVYKPLFLLGLLTGIKERAKRDFLERCLIDFIKF